MRDLISYPVHAAHRAHRSMNFSFLSPVWSGSQQHFERQLCISKMGYFTVVYLVARPLTWSEAEGDLVVIETSI